MATITADELKQTLANSGFVYDPKPTSTRVDESGSPIGQRYYVDDSGAIREVAEPKFLFRHLLSGEHFTADEILNYIGTERLNQTGRSRQQLVQDIEGMASQSAASPFGPNTLNLTEGQQAQLLSAHTETQRAYDASRNRGGFGGFLGDLVGGINEVVTAITDPVANALGVHPDVVKVAAAALGMYYAPGVGAVDAAGAAVSDAAAAEMIAAYGADALTAAGQMDAAAALASAAPAAPAAAAPAATAFPVATSPLATMGAATPLTAADIAAYNALAPGIEAADVAGTAINNMLVPSATTGPVTGAGTPLVGYGGLGDIVDPFARLSPISSPFAAPAAGFYGGAGDVLNPVTGAITNAPGTVPNYSTGLVGYGGVGDFLDPVTGNVVSRASNITSSFNPPMAGYGGAGDVLNTATGSVISGADAATGLGAAAAGAGAGAGAAGTISGYGGAGDVLNAATGGVITGADAATGLGAAAAGAATGAGAATNALSGYGGAGDVLDPVTGSVISAADAAAITNAGFNLSDFAKLAKDYGVPLSLLASAFMGSRAATNAAEIQAQSAREARQLARDIFNEQKALQEPYRAAGITAQNQLLNLLGLSGNTAAAEYGKFARPFGMSDFQQDPGYAFRLSEGMKALEASRAAKGGLLSGATGKALQRYGQEMGSQEYGSAFNRYQTERANRLQPLSGLTTLGQAAAANQGAAAGAFGQTAGNLTTSIGAAQAAGQVGMTNALTGALGQYLNYSSNQDLANAIAKRNSVYGPY